MSRAALQLQYTSCRRGVGGRKGFQFRVMSEGVRADDQREIEAAGGYTPPHHLPPEPSSEDIAIHFPVMFRSYKLGSGGIGLTRAQYVGQDYSGRPGNFFAHTLVTDSFPLWPIDYYEWAGWKGALEPAEDTDEGPDLQPLSTADVLSIEPAVAFTLEELRAFLAEAPGRAEHLVSMVQAVFLEPSTSRALVVRDTPLNGAFWLACIQKAFPQPVAATLSMSTYQFETRRCARINATTHGTEFTFDDTQVRFQFFMFDFLESNFSEVKSEAEEYAATVARWMAENTDELRAFHGFTEKMTGAPLDDSLLFPLRLFLLSRGEAKTLATPDLIAALQYGTRHFPPAARSPLLETVVDAAQVAAERGQAEQLSALMMFLADSLDEDQNSASGDKVLAAWVRAFDVLLPSRRFTAWKALADSRVRITEVSAETARRLAEAVLSTPRLAAVADAFKALPATEADALEHLTREVLAAARVLRIQGPWAESKFRPLFESAVSRARKQPGSAASFLRAFRDDPEGIAYAVASMVHDAEGDENRGEVERVVGTAIHSVASDGVDVAGVVRRLDRPEVFPALLGYFRALSLSSEPTTLYARAKAAILDNAPAFDAEHRKTLASDVFERLDRATQTRQALEWLQAGELEKFSPELQRECIEKASQSIPLSGKDPKTLSTARALHKGALKYRVELAPDRPVLRELLDVVVASGVVVEDLDLAWIARQLPLLEPLDYTSFLEDFLAPAFRVAKHRPDHRRILDATFVRERPEVFRRVCIGALEATNEAKALSPEAAEAAVRAWLHVTGPLESIQAAALAALTTRLAALSRAEFESLSARVNASALPSPTDKLWKGVHEEVLKRTQALWQKITGIFFGSRERVEK